MSQELYQKAIHLKKVHGSLSIVFLQRKLQIGYQQAKEIMEKIEDEIIRTLIKENPSHFDVNGDFPIVLNKNGKQLSMKEIIEKIDGMD